MVGLGRIDENGGFAVPEGNQTSSRPPTYNDANCPSAQLGALLFGDGVSAPLTDESLERTNAMYHDHDRQVAISWMSATTELVEDIATDQGPSNNSLQSLCYHPLRMVPEYGVNLNEPLQHVRATEEQEATRLPFMVQRLIHDQSCLHETFIYDEYGFPTKHCNMMEFVPMAAYHVAPTPEITGTATLSARRCSSRGTSGSHNTSRRRSRGSNDRKSSGDGGYYDHMGGQFAHFVEPAGEDYEDFVLYSSTDEEDIPQYDG